VFVGLCLLCICVCVRCCGGVAVVVVGGIYITFEFIFDEDMSLNLADVLLN